MKLYTIWAQYAGADGPDLVDAWDQWTREDNLSGWNESVAKWHKAIVDGDIEDMRVVELDVFYDDIQRAFATPKAEAKVT